AVQGFMPELGLAKENITFVSGIGCSSRFPYYCPSTWCPALRATTAVRRQDLVTIFSHSAQYPVDRGRRR
ncbi:hypothetical protein AB0934_26130, partial [Streptomyces griseus]